MKNRVPTLTTQRLLLREITASDIANIYKGLSHPDVIKHYGVSFNSLEATQEQMEWYAQSQQYWWAICAIDTQEFYGAAGLNSISTAHKKAEIGLWLLPHCWGKGIMGEVMPLVCDFGFNQLKLHRIEGFVDANNTNCKNAMAKLDFMHEGTMKDCEVKNGQYVSVDIYAKLNVSMKSQPTSCSQVGASL